MAYSIDDFARESNVSRETLEDYQLWHTLLLKWNRKINLVSPAALEEFWRRHALDSWQITPHIPSKAQNSLDLGSGAGFPAIAMAIDAKYRNTDHQNLMVESAGKKASFLRAVIRELNLPAKVTSERAEHLSAQPYDVISARAFAPLDRLFNYAQPFWGNETIGLFLKGENVDAEIAEAHKSWEYDVESIPSLSGATGCILKITGLRQKK